MCTLGAAGSSRPTCKGLVQGPENLQMGVQDPPQGWLPPGKPQAVVFSWRSTCPCSLESSPLFLPAQDGGQGGGRHPSSWDGKRAAVRRQRPCSEPRALKVRTHFLGRPVGTGTEEGWAQVPFFERAETPQQTALELHTDQAPAGWDPPEEACSSARALLVTAAPGGGAGSSWCPWEADRPTGSLTRQQGVAMGGLSEAAPPPSWGPSPRSRGSGSGCPGILPPNTHHVIQLPAPLSGCPLAPAQPPEGSGGPTSHIPSVPWTTWGWGVPRPQRLTQASRPQADLTPQALWLRLTLSPSPKHTTSPRRPCLLVEALRDPVWPGCAHDQTPC